MRSPRSGLAVSLSLLVTAFHPGCGGGSRTSERSAPKPVGGPPARAPGAEVQTEMRNVHFRVDEAVVLEIRSLSGSLISTHPGETPVFDDKASFYLKIRSAE